MIKEFSRNDFLFLKLNCNKTKRELDRLDESYLRKGRTHLSFERNAKQDGHSFLGQLDHSIRYIMPKEEENRFVSTAGHLHGQKREVI